MKKQNVFEFFFLPLISFGGLFIKTKWLSLTCFLFIVTMLPVLFWTELFKKSNVEYNKSTMGGSLFAAIILFGLEGIIVWSYLKFGPWLL